ncbi:MAG TPA: helix-turn-helix domain-containing protein [Acidimicrobiales bacterium]|nr:helix-turn-helix domain-containing protein [Acidimicrobiales bacterium]
MRSYDQYCAVARALDIVGDRWTLLIVRELLLRPCRYGELQDGLPGVATNLLAERLRHLEESGVVVRDEQGRYELTPWGKGLATPMRELVRWAVPLMNEKRTGDSFRARWLEIPFDLVFGGFDPSRPDLEVEVRAGGEEAVTLVSRGGEVRSHAGPANSPDVVVSGPADTIIGLLAGRLDREAAVEEGVSILGDFGQVTRLRQPDWLGQPSS